MLVDNEFIRIEEDAEQRVITMQRKASPATVEQLTEAYGEVLHIIGPQHAQYGLIIDTRQATGRNDSDFEHAVGRIRREAERRFARIVVLVSTAAGELQVRRLGREDARQIVVTRDPVQAIALASGS